MGGRTAPTPCRISVRAFLTLEARLLGRAPPALPPTQPAAARDREIRRRAACGEDSAAIARGMGLGVKVVLRTLGHLRVHRGGH
jgi:hypothetical protein